MTIEQQTTALPLGIVALMGCRCRCGHEWLPRDKGETPRVCPACKSPRWDLPKKFERKAPAVESPPSTGKRVKKPKPKG